MTRKFIALQLFFRFLSKMLRASFLLLFTVLSPIYANLIEYGLFPCSTQSSMNPNVENLQGARLSQDIPPIELSFLNSNGKAVKSYKAGLYTGKILLNFSSEFSSIY